MSILGRARDNLPAAYRADGGIIPRYNRTPTTHSTGYEYDTIGYNQRPWDIGNFVTQSTSTPTSLDPWNSPMVDISGDTDMTDTSQGGDGSDTVVDTNPYLSDDAADSSLAIQPDQDIWNDVPSNIQDAAEVLAVDPTNDDYNTHFGDVYDYWSDDADKNPTGQTTGYGITPEILDETGVDAWLPPTSGTTAVDDDLTKSIIDSEGFRTEAYLDTEGNWTIGYGTTHINGVPVKPGDTITQADAAAELQSDINTAQQAASNNYEGFNDFSPELQNALTEQAYQLGGQGQAGFVNMNAAIEAGDWDTAIAEAQDSVWAGQTPARVEELVAALEAEKAKAAPAAPVIVPAPVVVDNSSSNDDWRDAHNARHEANVKAAAAKAVAEKKAPVGSAGGPSPHTNRGGIIRKSNGGILSQPQTYNGILMNKLNRRNR